MHYRGFPVIILVFVCLVSAPVIGATTVTPVSQTPDLNGASKLATSIPSSGHSNNSTKPSNEVTPPSDVPRTRNHSVSLGQQLVTTSTNQSVERILLFDGELTDTRRTVLRNQSVTIGAVSKQRAVVTGKRTALSSLTVLPWVERLREPRRPQKLTVSEGVSSIGAGKLHSLNITGENVTIGVIDSGFDISNSEIEESIVAARAFDGQSWSGRHGTAVTEIVTDVAPDSDVAVAQISNGVEYEQALEWLTNKQDADIITTSLGFHGQPHDGSGSISKATTAAVESGTVVTVSAGNSAQQHWEGTGNDSDSDGWVEYNESGVEANYLNGGRTTGGPVDLYLTWDDWPSTTQDYNLYLYRSTTDGPELFAYSTFPQSSGGKPLEFIRTSLPTGRYFATIEAPDGDQASRVELFCSGPACRSGLSQRTLSSSITAPAVATGAVGVGAYDVESGALEPYSSRGPDNNGDSSVDLIGPAGVTTTAYSGSFAGTSAAAPHVAGVAALTEQLTSSTPKSSVVRLLKQGATNMDTSEDAVGAGRVSATGVLQVGLPPLNLSIKPDTESPYRVNSTVNLSAVTDVNRTTSVSWDLDNDGNPEAEGLNTTYRFADSGLHNISATVADGYGNSKTEVITLEAVAPTTLPATVSAIPEHDRISVGGSTEVDIRYNAELGVGEFSVVASSSDGRALSISDATAYGNESLDVVEANSSVQLSGNLEREQVGDNGVLATITVKGHQAAANVTVQLMEAEIKSPDSVSYGEVVVQNASLEIADGPGDVTGDGNVATDPDNDGVYEDVNGDGSANVLDIQAFFWKLDAKGVTGNPAFDVNGDSKVNILDVQALFYQL